MKKDEIGKDIPDEYCGPELVLVTKKSNNHKPCFRRITEKNEDYQKIYLVEKLLHRCKYFNEPRDGDIMYWGTVDELAQIIQHVIENTLNWELGGDDDAYSLVTESFDENVHWEEGHDDD